MRRTVYEQDGRRNSKEHDAAGERTGEDYIGEDGLLYCGQCHEPKEAYFDQEKVGVLGIKKHPRECECRRKKRKEEEQYREQQRHGAVVRELKEHCFSNKSMQEWTFENDKGLSENTVLAKLYVKDWETMKAENTGYLFWGAVEPGKVFWRAVLPMHCWNRR